MGKQGATLRPMRLKELLRAGATSPAHAYILKAGRKVVGFGGLIWRFNRCELFLEVRRPELAAPLMVVRSARRVLLRAAQLGEREVFCFRDEYPNSEKLLRLVGLHPYGWQEVNLRNGATDLREVWRWVA